MSRASDKGKDTAEGKVDSVGSLASDDDGHDNDNGPDVENDGREETPDLYRNSSLGMYVLRLYLLLTFVDDWYIHF
jgi:E3 ubiquitin-protein ligase HUWE1